MDEEIKTQRKEWQKPELIVLVRSKPEEAVLTHCKVNNLPGAGAVNNEQLGCIWGPPHPFCEYCSGAYGFTS